MYIYRSQNPLKISIFVSLQHGVDRRKLFLEVLLDSDKYTVWYTEISNIFLLRTPM